MSAPEISVVLPCFNGAATLVEAVESIRAQTLTEWQLILFDDGSTDATQQQLQDLDITVLRQPGNQGKGASLLNGFHKALELDSDLVITLDGDGQHDPEEIPRLLQAATEHTDSIIIAARLRQRSTTTSSSALPLIPARRGARATFS